MKILLITIAIVLIIALYIGVRLVLVAIIWYADNLKRKGLKK